MLVLPEGVDAGEEFRRVGQFRIQRRNRIFQPEIRQLEAVFAPRPADRIDEDADFVDPVLMAALAFGGSRIAVGRFVDPRTQHRVFECAAAVPVEGDPARKTLSLAKRDAAFAAVTPFPVRSETDEFHLKFSGEAVAQVADVEGDGGVFFRGEAAAVGIFQQNSRPLRTAGGNLETEFPILDFIVAFPHFPDAGLHIGEVEQRL